MGFVKWRVYYDGRWFWVNLIAKMYKVYGFELNLIKLRSSYPLLVVKTKEKGKKSSTFSLCTQVGKNRTEFSTVRINRQIIVKVRKTFIEPLSGSEESFHPAFYSFGRKAVKFELLFYIHVTVMKFAILCSKVKFFTWKSNQINRLLERARLFISSLCLYLLFMHTQVQFIYILILL